HPVTTRIPVGGGEAERPHDPQAEFVLCCTIATGVQNGPQNCAAQETDEQKIVEVPCLKGGVLTIVRETEKFALFLGNAAVAPVHPFEGSRDEQRGGRASPLTRQARQFGALTHAGMRLVEAARAEAELAGYKPEILPR